MSTALSLETAASVSVPWMAASWVMADGPWAPRPLPRPGRPPRPSRREFSRFWMFGADMCDIGQGLCGFRRDIKERFNGVNKMELS